MNITPEMIERGAKTLYESLPLAHVLPFWEDLNDLFREEWRERAKVIIEAALKDENLQELEAQCAAMREALEYASDYVHDAQCDEDFQAEIHARMCREALSSDAGRDLLERIKKLEVVAEMARDLIDWLNDSQIINTEYGVVANLEEALVALEDGEQNV